MRKIAEILHGVAICGYCPRCRRRIHHLTRPWPGWRKLRRMIVKRLQATPLNHPVHGKA